MSLLRLLSSLSAILLAISCSSVMGGGSVVHTYSVLPEIPGRAQDEKMAEYLKRHLQRRCPKEVLGKEGIAVSVHVGPDVDGDYAFARTKEGGYYLSAKDERTMTWLIYQFIKMAGKADALIETSDLPPLVLSGRDTVATFPFEYRDIYMPSNQNPDVTYVLGLHNLEEDWGIWGHNLSRVLGGNGDARFGYQNMAQELFAHQGGMVHQNQFCFSSDLLFDLTQQYIEDQYGNGQDKHVRFTIGPNDNDIVCMCRRCEAAGNTPTSATPAVLAFVEKLAARFPGHTFFIPGYSTTAALPHHALPSNMGVFLSAIDYPRTCNEDGFPQVKEFFERLNRWKQLTENVYIWDYICNFDDYLSPYPILYVMQQRLQHYRDQGVKGIFLNGSGYNYSIHQEMYTFVLASLLANPDADVDALVKEYYADALPHVGDFCTEVVLSMERHFKRSGLEFPLYGGMDEALKTYLFEREFRELYPVFLQARAMEMNHKERAVYEKTRQFVSFTFLEMCRLRGLTSGGFAELVGSEWVVKPEIWAAIEDLKIMTPEDDLIYLTGCENISMDLMDRVNEAGVYIADYENELEIWLSGQWWKGDYLLRRPLKVHYDGKTETTTKLTDGISGISQNYHWGWQIYPQQNELVFELPPDAVAGKSGEFFTCFLNSERHRMAPPKAVEIWADGRMVGALQREGFIDYYDEGEKVVFRGLASFGRPEHVELRVIPSHTRNVGLDELYFK